MFYIRVKWLHSSPYDPVDLYYEIDRDRRPHRGVEVLADGSVGRAGIDAPIPTLDEINAIPEFEAAEISEEEFEAVYGRSSGSGLMLH